MGEPAVTVMRSDDAPGSLGRGPQGVGGAWGDGMRFLIGWRHQNPVGLRSCDACRLLPDSCLPTTLHGRIMPPEMQRFAGIALMTFVGLPTTLLAEQAALPLPTITTPRAGDCRVDVEIPQLGNGSVLEVQINKGRVARLLVGQKPQLVVLPLSAPLEEGDEVRARLDDGGWGKAFAGTAGPNGPSVCASGGLRRETSDRPVFDATGFLGLAFDQFAPKVVGNYIVPTDPKSGMALSRRTAGLSLDYHVIGDGEFQFWVAGYALWGLRTADIDCKEQTDSPLCSNAAPTQDRFFFILEHASTVEAHFAPRLEFWTFQRGSETPLKVFVGGQLGFVHLEGAPKVSEIDHVGFGVIVPSGPFRKSFIQWSSGRTSLFQSNAKWNRFKVDGVLAFDLMPSLKERAAFWRYTGFGSWRGFVAISIDRNLRGPGPDAVQSYAGFAFDFRRAFRP